MLTETEEVLEDIGEEGKRTELVDASRGLRLLKKLRMSPHLKDSTSVVFPDPTCPNNFSFILGCGVRDGLNC